MIHKIHARLLFLTLMGASSYSAASTINFLPQPAVRCSVVRGENNLCAPRGTIVKIAFEFPKKDFQDYLKALLALDIILTQEEIYFQKPFRLLRVESKRTGYNEFYRPKSRFLDTNYEVFLIKE